jgi:hypothetical protein
MTLRATPTSSEQFAAAFRGLLQRVSRLERGPRGEVFFDTKVHMGDLVLEVRDEDSTLSLVAYDQRTPDRVVTIVSV